MSRSLSRGWLALLFVTFSVHGTTAVRAASPEELLPRSSVAYLRFDGMDAHRQAFDRTVLAKLLREDLGELTGYLTKLGLDALGPDLLSERLLEGAEPAKLLTLQKAARGVPVVAEQLRRAGFAASVEVIEPLAGKFQATMVFPGAGKADKTREAFLGAFRLIGLLSQAKIEQTKLQDREVLSFQPQEGVRLACWREGDHIVATLGSEKPARTLELLSGSRPNLTAHPLFQRVHGFKRYETAARGFLDVKQGLETVSRAVPPAKGVIKALGVDGLRSVAFHWGFRDEYQRLSVELETPVERRGVLKLLAHGQLTMKDLPPLPPDATSVYASHFDFSAGYDDIIQTIDAAYKAAAPFDAPNVRQAVDAAEQALGLKLRADLLDTLGNTVVVYNSPSQGPISLGTTLAVKVKDPQKLSRSFDALVKSLAGLIGTEMRVKTRTYRGAQLHQVITQERQFPFVPSYTIHNGWLVVSFYPQPVQGFILRSGADFSQWRPPAVVEKALAEAGKGKVTAISVTDPRPSVNEVLSVAPLITSFVKAFGGGGGSFDLSLIPNAQSVSEPLSHNVNIAVDDGKTIRFESYMTLPMPEVAGLDTYALVSIVPFIFLGF